MPTERDLLEWLPDGVIVCNREGEIIYANRQAEDISGYRRAELIGRKAEALIPAALRDGQNRGRRRAPAPSDGQGSRDLKLRRKDGTLAPVELEVGPVDSHIVVVIRDEAERRTREEALEHLALHDPLTALANRNLFFDRLHQSLHAARREGGQVALVMLDLDDFKAVNDAYGHAAGDAVLRELGVRLSAGLRATDTAARIGGDEFAWILPKVTSHDSVVRTVHKRLAHVRQPIDVRGHAMDIGISAGIAIYPDDGRDVDTLMRHADAAMYSAKRQGIPVAFHLPRRREA